MAMVIATNMGSITAQRHLSNTQNDLNTSMERLSSGNRINSAMDDAAGLQIRDRMDSQINGLTQAVRNSNDAISLAQTAEGALEETTEILQRMRDLAVQATNDTYTTADRESLQSEVDQLLAEIDNISKYTRFNDQQLLNGDFANKNFQVGANNGETIGLSIGKMDSSVLGKTDAVGANGDITGQTTPSGGTVAKDFEAAGTIESITAASSSTVNVEGVDGVDAADAVEGVVEISLDTVTGVATDTMTIKLGNGDEITSAALTGTADTDVAAAFVLGNASNADYTVAFNGEDGIVIIQNVAGDADMSVTSITNNDESSTNGSAFAVTAHSVTAKTDGKDAVDAVAATAWSATQTFTDGASKGDSIAFKIDDGSGGTVQDFTYTADENFASAIDLANNIADTLSNNYDGYVFSASNGVLTVQSLTSGDTGGHDLQTVTSQYSGQTATAQTSTFTVGTASTGATDGDTMTITINGDSWTYEEDTGSAVATGALLAAEVKSDWDDAAAAGGWQSAYTLSVSGDEITVTAKNAGSDGAFDLSISYDQNAAHQATAAITNLKTDGSADLTSNPSEAIRILDEAITQVGSQRSDLGAFQNRLDHNISNVQSTIENTSAARSRIEDADFATESANLAKAQVLQQAGTAMLAQANASTQNVMSLLR